MQRDEGIGIVPVPAGLGVLVDEGDMAIRVFVEQRIGKGEADRARADDEVIGCVIGHAAPEAFRRAT